MVTELDDVEELVAAGDAEGALDTLGGLHKRVDGCGSMSDRNDWIVECAARSGIRSVFELLMANLGG